MSQDKPIHCLQKIKYGVQNMFFVLHVKRNYVSAEPIYVYICGIIEYSFLRYQLDHVHITYLRPDLVRLTRIQLVQSGKVCAKKSITMTD